MIRGLFVAGTDTCVGKTVACAALMRRYRGRAPLRYWKPVQTGRDADDDTATVRTLAACSVDEVWDHGIRLAHPLSPHLAARLEGREIDVDHLVKHLPGNAARYFWLVEGAGGALAPLTDRELFADWVVHLRIPAIVVARSTLGTINHTLLTIEAFRRRGVGIAGVVMVGPPDAENRAAIEQFGKAPVLGELPRWDPLTPEALAEWSRTDLDPRGVLEDLIR